MTTWMTLNDSLCYVVVKIDDLHALYLYGDGDHKIVEYAYVGEMEALLEDPISRTGGWVRL